MPQYIFSNGPFPTTAAQAAVTTGTAIKTLLQVKGVTAVTYKVKQWSISFDGFVAALPIKCELLETGTVFATVTAAVAADIAGFNDAGAPTSTTFFSVGTAATGYTASAEGSITATRVFDVQFVAPSAGYTLQWPLGCEPEIAAVSALRIRVTAGTAVNAYCSVILLV